MLPMVHRPGEIASRLQSKFAFVEDDSRSKDHKCFVLRLDGLPPIRTKVSHSRSDVRDKLLGIMAKELQVRTTFLNGMLDCSNSRDDYENQVRTDPFPGWPQRSSR